MAHRMGLVQLNPTTKSVATTLTYTYNKTDGGYTSSTSGTSTITASDDFTGNKPYHANSQYGHIVKATGAATNIAKAFTCNVNQKDFWSEKSSGTDVGYGRYKVINIQSDRNAANFVALFSCVKTCQTVTLPWYDTYKMECWGAKGSNCSYGGIGGNGGYTMGTISFGKISLYVFVGGGGAYDTTTGGWNGGGNGYIGPTQFGYGGGGATDIRVYVNSMKAWDDTESIKSRIMVAGGGGGSGSYNQTPSVGGAGGGLQGQGGYQVPGYTWSGIGYSGTGGTQTDGGEVGQADGQAAININNEKLNSGGLGYGGYHYGKKYANFGAPGGGSGYWGGAAANRGHGGGGGGSSFISGMTGCIAPLGYQGDNSAILKYNNVQYKFADNALTIMGNSANLPNNPGYESPTVTQGYAKITSQ